MSRQPESRSEKIQCFADGTLAQHVTILMQSFAVSHIADIKDTINIPSTYAPGYRRESTARALIDRTVMRCRRRSCML